MIYLSICIPTNGITEWVQKVIESIYIQRIDDSLFEVIITDNGNNADCQKIIERKYGKHKNLKYIKTNAQLFLNQVESFRNASGALIKFQNHRTVMNIGSIQYLINIAQIYYERRPTIFFCDNINLEFEWNEYKSFDDFISSLGYLSSYSGGLSFWKSDFEHVLDKLEYNSLFPHTSILFHYVDKDSYVICCKSIGEEITTDHRNKGDYKFYYAFGVEFPSIVLDLYKNESITYSTYKKVINCNESFLVNNYIKFTINNEPHSYDTSHSEEYLNVFYKYYSIRLKAYLKYIIKRIIDRKKNEKERDKVSDFGSLSNERH